MEQSVNSWFLTGEVLAQALLQPPKGLDPVVEQFLYRRATTLLVADPGLGKSTVAINIAACLTTARPVFQQLIVPHPMRVCYLPFETGYEEFLDQAYAMRVHQPLDPYHLLWMREETLLSFNALRPDHIKALLTIIQQVGGCDLLIIDPLYLAVGGSLEKSEPVIAFCKALVLLRTLLNCAILILHHTHRERHNAKGKVIVETDPFYGSIYLKAHVHASYLITMQDEKHKGVILTRKKDRGKQFVKALTLDYHPDWMGLTMRETINSRATLKERLLRYLNAQVAGFTIDFYTLADVLECTYRHLHRLTEDQDIQHLVTVESTPGRKRTIWRKRETNGMASVS